MLDWDNSNSKRTVAPKTSLLDSKVLTDNKAVLRNAYNYDKGLGDSEMGESASSKSYQSCQAVHSDQSEDSSLTDSERTLIGDELSPRNNSPDITGSEIDQDLEPLRTALEVSKPECDTLLGSSDTSCPVHGLDETRNIKYNIDFEPLNTGGEVSKPECDTLLGSSETLCPVHGQDETRNMSSPEENTKDSKCSTIECSKNTCTCAKVRTVPEPSVKRHFRAYTYYDYETGEKSKFTKLIYYTCLNKILKFLIQSTVFYSKFYLS